MIRTVIALVLMSLTVFMTGSDLNAQQYSSSPELEVLPGESGYDTIDVTGIGSSIYFTFGLVNVCVSLEIARGAGCGELPKQIFLELHTPELDWTLATTSSFPNEIDSLVNTCFTWCPSFDDVNTTADVSPFSDTYDAHEAFYYADSTMGDGDWSLSVYALCSHDTVILHDWNLNFGPLVPIPTAPVLIDPTCPGAECHRAIGRGG